MQILFGFLGALSSILQIFSFIVNLLGIKYDNYIPKLPWSKAMKLLGYPNENETSEDNYYKVIKVVEDPANIAPEQKSLTLYVPLVECDIILIDWKLLVVVAWVIIRGFSKLGRTLMKEEEDDDVFDKSNEDEVFSEDEDENHDFIEEKDVFDYSQTKDDWSFNFENDADMVFTDLESDLKEANTESFENIESLDSDEKNGYYPDEEKFGDLSEFEEKSFTEEGSPEWISDEEEIRLYFKAKEELSMDVSSDEEEKLRYLGSKQNFGDLPSEEE